MLTKRPAAATHSRSDAVTVKSPRLLQTQTGPPVHGDKAQAQQSVHPVSGPAAKSQRDVQGYKEVSAPPLRSVCMK